MGRARGGRTTPEKTPFPQRVSSSDSQPARPSVPLLCDVAPQQRSRLALLRSVANSSQGIWGGGAFSSSPSPFSTPSLASRAHKGPCVGSLGPVTPPVQQQQQQQGRHPARSMPTSQLVRLTQEAVPFAPEVPYLSLVEGSLPMSSSGLLLHTLESTSSCLGQSWG